MKRIGSVVSSLVEGLRLRLAPGDNLPVSGTDADQSMEYLDRNRDALRLSWDNALFHTPGASRGDITAILDRYSFGTCLDQNGLDKRNYLEALCALQRGPLHPIQPVSDRAKFGFNSFPAQPDPPAVPVKWFITSTPESVFEEFARQGADK